MVNSEEKQQPTRLSTAHSRELGEELRRVRHRARMSSSVTAEAMDWSLGKLSKLETGTRGTGVLDIAALLGQYHTDKATREHILTIATERDTGSFVRRHDRSPDTLAALRVHERIARTVTAYEPLTVPALAQTEDYALALTSDRAVARIRMDRQQEQLARRELVIYLHEAALRVRVGTPQIMRDQLLHLTLMGGWADTRIRIVPLTNGFDAMLRAIRPPC
jgi:transcriptional regulator with XRE-family HTH domain